MRSQDETNGLYSFKSAKQEFRLALYAAVIAAVPELRTYCDCLQDNAWHPCLLEQVDILQSLRLLQDGVNPALSPLTELVTLPASAFKDITTIICQDCGAPNRQGQLFKSFEHHH